MDLKTEYKEIDSIKNRLSKSSQIEVLKEIDKMAYEWQMQFNELTQLVNANKKKLNKYKYFDDSNDSKDLLYLSFLDTLLLTGKIQLQEIPFELRTFSTVYISAIKSTRHSAILLSRTFKTFMDDILALTIDDSHYLYRYAYENLLQLLSMYLNVTSFTIGREFEKFIYKDYRPFIKEICRRAKHKGFIS